MDELTIYKNKDLKYPITQNLAIIDIKNSKLTKDEQDVILASKCFPKINKIKGIKFPEGTIIDKEDVTGREIRQYFIKQHINTAITHSGYGTSLTEKELSELILSVLKDILVDFGYLTIQEVGIALKKGVREDYGEYRGVNTRIFYVWLKSFVNQTKLNANKELKKIDIPKENIITEEILKKRKKEWLESIFKLYNDYVETGEYKIYDTNNMFYDYLKSLDIIKITAKEKKVIIKEAELQLKTKYNPLLGKDEYERNSFLKMIDLLNKKDKSVKDKLLSTAKHIYLKNYLSSLRKTKKSLQSIITKKTQY